METRKINVQQGTIGVPVQEPAEDFRLNQGGLWTPDGSDALKNRSGILAGPGSGAFTPCQVISSGASNITVKPGRFLVQGSTALSGSYLGTIDADKSRTISGLPTSGNFKAGRVVVHIYDQVYGSGSDGWDIEILLGAQATTAGAAVLPTIPGTDTYLELRQFTVTSAGAVSFIGPLPLPVTTAGGIAPVLSTDVTAGAFTGQARDHPTKGLQRWNGSAWEPVGWPKFYWFKDPAYGNVSQTLLDTPPKVFGAFLGASMSAISFWVGTFNYAAAGFTEAPIIQATVGGENSAALWVGIDNILTGSCTVIARSSSNITLNYPVSVLAIGR